MGGWLGTAAVAGAAPLLARLDLRRLRRCLEPSRSSRLPSASSPLPSADPAEVIEAVGRRVDGVIRWGRPLVRPGCLTRGIVGYYLLRRVGLDVALCFGIGPVRRSDAPGTGVAAHCWLVLDGEPVLETADPRTAFTEIVRISSYGLTKASLTR